MAKVPQSTGYFDRTALRYLARVVKTEHPSDEPFVLNRNERRVIGWIEVVTMLLTAGLGVMAVWAFYMPDLLWPAFFSETYVGSWHWPLIRILFATLLAYLLFHATVLVYTWSIRLVELACQFPRFHDAQFGRHLRQLASMAPFQRTIRFQFSPRPLLPWTLPGYIMAILLLTFITIGIIHLVVKMGTPISLTIRTSALISSAVILGWNIWASFQILREAKIRIIAPLTIRQFVNELAEEFGREPAFREMIPAVLAAISFPTKPSNYPQLMLLETIQSRFSAQPEVTDRSLGDYLKTAPLNIRQGLERLLLFSVLIDGYISSAEKRQLQQLASANQLSVTPQDIKLMHRSHIQGRGLWV